MEITIIVEGGKLNQSYDEKQTANYMKNENIDINIETFTWKEKLYSLYYGFNEKIY